jgi:transcriptional regulator with XRE-family HTH domain
MSPFEQLQSRRTQLGKSLLDVSRITGMSSSHLSNILNGKKDAQSSTLTALADALDAKWMLIPRHLLPEIERLLSGKTTVDRLFGGDANE